MKLIQTKGKTLNNNSIHTVVEQTKEWRKINEIDFSMIENKLCHPKGKNWSKKEAKHYIKKYKQWLYLCLLFPDKKHVPSEKIDEVWHHHILDTQSYMKDCKLVFGYILHHYPYFGIRNKKDEKNLSDAYVATQKLFKEVWGQDMSPDISSMCNGGSEDGGTCHMIDEGKK